MNIGWVTNIVLELHTYSHVIFIVPLLVKYYNTHLEIKLYKIK